MPQGSVLGPLTLCVYMPPIGSIKRHHDIYVHIYADDTQLYVSFDLSDPNAVVDRMNLCISDLHILMIRRRNRRRRNRRGRNVQLNTHYHHTTYP